MGNGVVCGRAKGESGPGARVLAQGMFSQGGILSAVHVMVVRRGKISAWCKRCGGMVCVVLGCGAAMEKAKVCLRAVGAEIMACLRSRETDGDGRGDLFTVEELEGDDCEGKEKEDEYDGGGMEGKEGLGLGIN